MDKHQARLKGIAYRRALSTADRADKNASFSHVLSTLLDDIRRTGRILSYRPLAYELQPPQYIDADIVNNTRDALFPQDQYQIIIIPAVAVDLSGVRVGMGGGWYDRFLAHSDATLIACCFDGAVYDNITAESHDIRVDYICTESRVIKTTVVT